MNPKVEKSCQNLLTPSVEGTKQNSTKPNSFVEQFASSPRSALVYDSKISLETSAQPSLKCDSRDYLVILGQKIQIFYESEESVSQTLTKIENNLSLQPKTKANLQIVILKRGLSKNRKLLNLFQRAIKKYQMSFQKLYY